MKHRVEWLVAALLLAQYTPAQTAKLLRQEVKLLPYRLSEAKKRGFPMTFLEAYGPEIPDGENAAKIVESAERQGWSAPEDLNFYSMPSKEIDKILKDAEPYLAKTYLAASKPRFQPTPSNLDLDFPVLAMVRSAVKRLCFRAEVRAREGDTAGGLSDIRAAGTIGNFPLQRSTIISCLVAVACSSIVCSRCERLANFWEHQPKELAALETIVNETYRPINGLELTRQEAFGSWQTAPYAAGLDSKNPVQGVQLEEARSMKLAVDLRRFDAMRKDPLRPWKGMPSSEALEKRLKREVNAADAMEAILDPVMDETLSAFRKRTAYQNCMISLLRCLQYRASHGRLAPTLHEMSADLEDPCSEKPLRLVKTADGFRVYSIGDDGKDDHGVTGREMKDFKRGDFALGSPPVISRPGNKS